jgi:nucleoside-diphosphate-sugar epimerase
MRMLDGVVATVKAGNWQWVDGGAQAMSTCHRDNLVDALLLATEKGKGGRAYFVADAEEGTLKSVLGDLLAAQQVKAADKSISFGMAWTVAGIMAVGCAVVPTQGRASDHAAAAALDRQAFTVRTEQARRELGFIPRVTWKDGIAEMASCCA